MNVRSLSLAAAVLLAAAAVSSAEDAKSYKVRFATDWKTGDVVTRQSKETEATNVVVKQEGGADIPEQKGSTTTSFRLVEKCLAAEGGKSTKRLLFFVSWSIQGDGPEGAITDDCLTGTHVEVTASGTSNAWTVVTPGKEISDVAKGWLDKKFGAGSGEHGDEVISPKEPVAPGASWAPDVAEVAKSMGNGAMDIDPATSSVKVAFLEVQTTKTGEFGKFALDMELHTKSLATPQGTMAWKDGGVIHAKGMMLRALADRAFDEERAMDMTLAGVAEAGPGVTVSLDYKASGQEAVGAGGDMPPVPAAPPAK
jgi:hypothetical protein